MHKIIIAVDGYSSCGKSTLAKQLATAMHYVYVDSGAMYRAITLFFIRNSTDINNNKDVEQALNNIKLHFVFDVSIGKSGMYLNDENVEKQIREMPISDHVSNIAAIEKVRAFAVKQQCFLGKNKGIVMDGRDIGTTVFPGAELKIFMIADINVRVERRFKELYVSNKNITHEEVKHNLEMRDHIDSTRAISPLRKAADAVVLDNSNLTMQQQLNLALQWAGDKINK